MKVLLIQPPYTILKNESKRCQPPLGLAYIAAVLKDRHLVAVLDAVAEGYNHEERLGENYLRYGLAFDGIKRGIERFEPDVVGVSCPFSTVAQNAHAICRLVKDLHRNIITVLGGAHPSALAGKVLEDDNVDFVIIGEGEYAMKSLLQEIEGKRRFLSIEGIAYRENGQVKVNPKVKFWENLDEIPFPHWEIFPLKRYFEINRPHGAFPKRRPFLPMITSRGCPNRCIFCSVHSLWGRKYRKRSANNVLLEINHLITEYGVKEIHFEDDNLTLDRLRAKQIFEGIINSKFDLSWSDPNGVAINTLDEEMIELMEKSGCYHLSFAVESGDEFVLHKIIKKPLDLSTIKPLVKIAKKIGLETTAFFVVGFPDETKSQLKNTFNFAQNLNVDNVNFFFATPLPGTELLGLCQNKGLLPKNFDYNELRSEKPVFGTEEFSREELEKMVARQKRKFYLNLFSHNPKRLFTKLLQKIAWKIKGYFYSY